MKTAVLLDTPKTSFSSSIAWAVPGSTWKLVWMVADMAEYS